MPTLSAPASYVPTGTSGPSIIKPELSISYQGAQPFIDWKWDSHSAFLDVLELQVDRGHGWQPLARETTPGHLDTAPLPVQPERWRYRGIYCVGDQPVGQWSDAVSLIVGGQAI